MASGLHELDGSGGDVFSKQPARHDPRCDGLANTGIDAGNEVHPVRIAGARKDSVLIHCNILMRCFICFASEYYIARDQKLKMINQHDSTTKSYQYAANYDKTMDGKAAPDWRRTPPLPACSR